MDGVKHMDALPQIMAMQRQLVMARYAMHCVRSRDYALAATHGKITKEQAAEEYRKAMDNFDDLLARAVREPELIPDLQNEMADGFCLPSVPDGVG